MSSRRPISVVIAEDDTPLRTLLRFVLNRNEELLVVAEAADGLEALEQVERHQPDLLLLDLSMPHMDGLEVLRRLQGRAGPTVVVLSALGEAEPGGGAERSSRELGAAAYVSKATAFDVLADTLIRVVE